jgi:hypothetical protein
VGTEKKDFSAVCLFYGCDIVIFWGVMYPPSNSGLSQTTADPL